MRSSSTPAAPTRDEVAAHWVELIQGRLSRAEAHAWASQWVGVAEAEVADLMAENGLLHLHGFSMTATGGSQDDYVHTHSDIVDAYGRWLHDCARFDADPTVFMSEKRAEARAYLERERRSRG